VHTAAVKTVKRAPAGRAKPAAKPAVKSTANGHAKAPAVAQVKKAVAPPPPAPKPVVAPPPPPPPVPVPAPAAAAPVAPARPSVPPHMNGRVYTPPPAAPFRPVNFKVGDKAVHPAHGVGEVTSIDERDIGGTKQMFYTLRILDNQMKVMVPMSAAAQVGLRGIMSSKEADAILETMRAREVAVDLQPWSRRFRVYTEMIKSGSPTEVAKVLRDMNRLKFDKDLSFGERRLLDQAKSLLMKELAFAKKMRETDLAEQVRQIFSA
jgi:CarD family transcriptional regulator